MARYLFVHQNFPGQFPHISRALAERGDEVVAIGEANRIKHHLQPHSKIKLFGYPEPQRAGAQTHRYLHGLEGHVRRGQAALRVALQLKQQGFHPDVIVAHPGWGEALFLKEAFPKARHIHYLEFFYQTQGADVGFDPEFPVSIDDTCRVRIKNSTQLLSFDSADAGISPTEWQKSRFPSEWNGRIARLHDGIDTTKVRPDPDATFVIGGTVLSAKDEVLTYIARNLEPYRGFHTFMRAVPSILERRPSAHILIVGGDDVSYGLRPRDGLCYRDQYQRAWGPDVDRSRAHFLGRLPYAKYLRALQVSSLHVYLTYPFVLSWSMLEAMSAGCLVLGSATAPVQEVIRDGENGYLTDFFDASTLAQRAADLLASRHELAAVRRAARETIRAAYDLEAICLPRLLEFLSPAPN